MRQLGAQIPETPRESYREPRLELREPQLETRQTVIGIEAVPPRQGAPWGLLDEDRGPRVPFLTIALPALAVILAIGAFLWSGSMRDRLRQQDAAMNALQEQNAKLADRMKDLSLEQSVAGDSRTTQAQRELDARAADLARQQQLLALARRHQDSQASGPPEAASSQAAQPQTAQPQAAPGRTERQEAEPARLTHPVQPESPPEIVPPYPTNFTPKPIINGAPGQSFPQGVPYREPVTVAANSGAASVPGATQSAANQSGASQSGANQSATNQGAAANQSRPQTPAYQQPRTVATLPAESPAQYFSQGNSLYASPLAQNIEAVQGLQRHSTVPLQEFHVHEGMMTRVNSSLGLSVKHPEAGHGTYGLVVYSGQQTYQMKGQVNNPLVFTDSATRRQYELVVLHIADQQIYGYVRAMR